MPKTTKAKLPKAIKLDEVGVDNTPHEIDVPLHLQGGEFHWNFEKRRWTVADKVTLALTIVNIAILITLIVKNI